MNFTRPTRTLCLIAAWSLLSQAASAQVTQKLPPGPVRVRTAVEVSEAVSVASGLAEATAAVIPPKTNQLCRQGRLFFGSLSYALSWSESGNLKFVNVFVPAVTRLAVPQFASVKARVRVNSPPQLAVPAGAASELSRKIRQH
ncbi:MAG: hypothetical protein M3416_09420 [Acidobacteriota bacterium]|nr:hypothetical protein [Acidobacteriota bacterium]